MNAINTDGQRKLSVTQIRNILKKEFELHINLNIDHTFYFDGYLITYHKSSLAILNDKDSSFIAALVKINTLTDAAWIIFNKRKMMLVLKE